MAYLQKYIKLIKNVEREYCSTLPSIVQFPALVCNINIPNWDQMNWKWIKKSVHSSNHLFSTIYSKKCLFPVITRCLFRIAVAWLRRLSLVEQEAPAVLRVAPRPPLLHPLHPPALPRILVRNRTTATMDMRLDTTHTMMSRPHGLTAPGPSASLTQARVPAEKWISDWGSEVDLGQGGDLDRRIITSSSSSSSSGGGGGGSGRVHSTGTVIHNGTSGSVSSSGSGTGSSARIITSSGSSSSSGVSTGSSSSSSSTSVSLVGTSYPKQFHF